MPRKVVASKKRRTREGSSTTPHFEEDRFFHRYQRLAAKSFGRTRYIYWGVVTQLWIADWVQSMLGVGGWDKVFSINHETFREATLEVLSTFEAYRSSIQERSLIAISFQLFGEKRTMSYTLFSLLMGFYDMEALHTREHREGTHTRLRTITAGPYITHLIIGMGLEEKTEGMERLQLMAAMGMSTLCQMGLVKHVGGRYILVGQSADSSDDVRL
ncbi:hypothetical protein J5N97_009834 [Dioscorea zingiberensis]|uniref:Arabidopsis retrotransposon Orf1 C-terminal domain-containing protein n=1 Tax=Dioscorea zingiberensis TaxID=325984 RepID=A0A9D5CZ39_9LILI|nr:hypothetical protein J5N97_009834 [Dioscorea zingiberensis]